MRLGRTCPPRRCTTREVTVYTIGHSNASFDQIAELLQKHAIQVLVDVRSRPHSRWVPWTNQKNLETEIPKLGIEYRYAGNYLGGLPDDPTLLKLNPKRRRKTDPMTIADYHKIAKQDWFQDAVEKLIEVANERRTAIMCSEENPEKCHRSQLLGRALAKRDIKVMHIRKDGSLEAQSVSPKVKDLQTISAVVQSTHCS